MIDKHLKKLSSVRKKRNVGLPPGTALYTGKKDYIPVHVNYVEFNKGFFREELAKPKRGFILYPPNPEMVQWYDVRGLHDLELIQKIAEAYNIHPIAIEDAIDFHQRPTYVEYQNGHFICLKHLKWDEDSKLLSRQSVAVYFGAGFVITFQEEEDDIFSEIRARIKHQKGRIRSRKEDYLTYAIVDSIVDRYFQVLDQIEIHIDQIEFTISTNPDQINRDHIFDFKKELLKIRKAVTPLREAINMFSRTESKLMQRSTLAFIKDVYDHTIHIIDNVDSLRDILSGLQDLYLSELSMKMNKVMQFLTVVTAVFVPISFLTGLYGMNFQNMPELTYQNGYFVLLGVIITSVVLMLIYFWRKRWL